MWKRTTVIVSQSLERMCTSSPHTTQCNWCPTSTTYASVLFAEPLVMLLSPLHKGPRKYPAFLVVHEEQFKVSNRICFAQLCLQLQDKVQESKGKICLCNVKCQAYQGIAELFNLSLQSLSSYFSFRPNVFAGRRI